MRITWRVTGLFAAIATVVVPTALAFGHSQSLASRSPATQRSVSTRPLSGPYALRLAIPNMTPVVDPALVADEQNVPLANLLYSGLVRLDSQYRVVPDAAARYSVSADHRRYTFYLRKNLSFSNGDPVTAADFRFSITRSLNPAVKSPSAPTYLLDISGARQVLEGKAKSVSGIKVLDSRTLQITTDTPVPYFLMELTYPTSFVLDRKQITRLGPPENTNWYSSPVGTGPFRLKSWNPNSKMLLVPNKHYYGPRTPLKSVSVALGPLPDTDLFHYLSHNLDVVSLASYNAGLLHQPGIRETKMLAVDGIYMNFKAKPFANLHIRRALTLALNRSTLVSHQMGATVSPFAGHVPPGQAGYDGKLRTRGYDPVTARHELKAAGPASLKALGAVSLYYPDDPTVAKLAVGIARAWRTNLKLTIDTHALTINTLLAKVQSNSLPLYLLGWSADYPDPHDFLTLQWKTRAPNNNVHFSNKQFDATVSAADVTWPYGPRMRLYDTAQQQLVDDAAWIPLYIPHRLVYVRPSVVNLVLTGYGLIPRVGTWSQVEVRPSATKNRS